MNQLVRSRLDPKIRKDAILVAAVECAKLQGLSNIRRDTIAGYAGVANGLVSRYFSTMTQLRRAVVRYAVHNEVLPIVAQALALRDPEALKASDELKKKAVASLNA